MQARGWAVAALALCGLACGASSGGAPATDAGGSDTSAARDGRADDARGGDAHSAADDTPSVADQARDDTPCAPSCGALGARCGEACGERCGTCPGDTVCSGHACVCAPTCAEINCDESDGCGGVCPACPLDISCPECTLRLAVIDEGRAGGARVGVTLAIEFAPAAGDAHPSLADLHLEWSGPVRVTDARAGAAALAAGKALASDPDSGRPYLERREGLVQLVLLSTASDRTIGPGRLAELDFVWRGGEIPSPIVVNLVRREQVFAPPAADGALWPQPYEQGVAIWP